ncbi:MAG: hypothetical protein QXM31_00525 [Candidatus Woesearchaeota archaeon]
MKISIDTAADSKEDIRKAIRLLQSLVEHEGSRNIFDSPSPSLFSDTQARPEASPAAAFGNLFGDNAPAQQSTLAEVPVEKKEKEPRIELY